MVYNASAGAAVAVAAAAHAALVQAVKASGVLVQVEPEAFLKVVGKTRGALVVYSVNSAWRKKEHCYLTSYKGLAFNTKSPSELIMPGDIELVYAKQIWMPQ